MEKVEKVDKAWNIFKKMSDAYYNWKKRNEQLQEFLDNSEANKGTLESIGRSLERVNSSVTRLNSKMEIMEKNLKTVSEGTKMELFDTLHTWRGILVVNKKWASAEEKKEIENIYKIYKDLEGNGQGKHYYEEIMALPESEQELNELHGGK